MEFSTAYSLSPAWNSTRTLPYPAARFFDEGGRELDIPPPISVELHLKALGSAMLAGRVYADLSDAPTLLKKFLHRIQPASPTPFECRGIRLFEDRFEVRLFGEGTIRGTGGLRIAGNQCETTVDGLFAAGDVATRELVAGATSGGGAQNSAWALTSGLEAGDGAAAFAKSRGRRLDGLSIGASQAALRPLSGTRPVERHAIVATVQNEMMRYDKALWRTKTSLEAAALALDRCWHAIVTHEHAVGLDRVAARETASMVATARWCTASALARKESRGMHMRADLPSLYSEGGSRLITGG